MKFWTTLATSTKKSLTYFALKEKKMNLFTQNRNSVAFTFLKADFKKVVRILRGTGGNI